VENYDEKPIDARLEDEEGDHIQLEAVKEERFHRYIPKTLLKANTTYSLMCKKDGDKEYTNCSSFLVFTTGERIEKESDSPTSDFTLSSKHAQFNVCDDVEDHFVVTASATQSPYAAWFQQTIIPSQVIPHKFTQYAHPLFSNNPTMTYTLNNKLSDTEVCFHVTAISYTGKTKTQKRCVYPKWDIAVGCHCDQSNEGTNSMVWGVLVLLFLCQRSNKKKDLILSVHRQPREKK
ncbi:MAG TPA: hypothetical protein DCE42_23915, partial [Myxococcales bacterium]|nr:hypothetical protein [Myxococcales bacterium]